jgi:hypothetical protein
MEAAYAEWLAALENSALGHLARHSPWAYTSANVLHVLGAALLVGAIAVFDGTLLARRFTDAAAVGRVAIPIAAGGLALQVPTGVLLLAAEARALGQNPGLLRKTSSSSPLGLLNVGLFHAWFGSALRRGVLSSGARWARIRLLGGVGSDPRGGAHDRLSLSGACDPASLDCGSAPREPPFTAGFPAR